MQNLLMKMILDTTGISKRYNLNLIDSLKLIDYSISLSLESLLLEEDLLEVKEIYLELNNLLIISFKESSKFKGIFDNEVLKKYLNLNNLLKFKDKRLEYYYTWEKETVELYNNLNNYLNIYIKDNSDISLNIECLN